MDLELTDEQEMLVEASDRYMRERAPRRSVLEWADTVDGIPEGYVASVADLGWFALLAGDLHSGGVAREGMGEAALIAEVRGRYLQPAPYTSTCVTVAALSKYGGSPELSSILGEVVAGRAVATWAFDWSDPSAVVGPGVSSSTTGGDLMLNGRVDVVEYGADADWILVTGIDDSGAVSQAIISAKTQGLEVERRRSMDVTRRVGRLTFRDVRVDRSLILGDMGGAAQEAEWQAALAAALCTAETVGAMDCIFELARQYSLDRVAFGRPIGSFQAIKHQLADLSLTVESSKAVATMAVRSLDEKDPAAAEVCSIAKAWTSDGGVDVAQGCFQVFGGIGFTWEHECHLFLRRLTMNSLLFGTAEWHRERLCSSHGL